LSSFVLRILFSGLMAFVPNEDGTEVTVLLLNVDHAHHTSDGAVLPPHKPLLLARAGNCTGACPKRESAIANFVYSDVPAAADSLESALGNGGGWVLSGSDIVIRKGDTNDPELPTLSLRTGVRTTIIPTTSSEREDLSWIPNIKQLCAGGCTLNPAVLGNNPPSGLIAARIRLRSGNVFTYSVARVGGNVTPVHFQRLDGTGSGSSVQAIASMVGVDVQVSGSSIEIAESSFSGSAGRTMRLEPDAGGKVEVAVLNLPAFVPPASPNNDAPEVGKHFEAYYDLLQNPPARETRLVPRAGAASATYPQVGWQAVHPQSVLWSDLLNALRMNAGRSMYDRVLCPPAGIPLP
jgi:hypothetical protein